MTTPPRPQSKMPRTGHSTSLSRRLSLHAATAWRRSTTPRPSNMKTPKNLPPPAVIPYSANVPADPNLWDGDFRSTSLFGTMSSFKATFATWPALYNGWLPSSDNETLKTAMATTSPNLPYSETLHGLSYLLFLDLAGISCTHQVRPLFETTLHYSLEKT